MSLYIGNQKLGSLYLGSTKIKEAWVGDVKVYGSGDPYNPLNLPPFTIRVRLRQDADPSWWTRFDSYEIVDETNNIWDCHKNSTDWSYLFSSGRYLDRSYGLLEVLGANTTDVTIMRSLFSGCASIQTVPLFDTSSVTNMRYMFGGRTEQYAGYCESLLTIPRFDTSKVTNMEEMFTFCTSLRSIPLLDTSKVTSMYWMFRYCGSLVDVPHLDTSSCTNMDRMFYGTSSLKSVPVFDMSSCTTTSYMFGDSGLEYIPQFNITNLTSVYGTFYRCREVKSGALSLYRTMSSQSSIPAHSIYTFQECGIHTTTGLAELQQIPSSWGGLAPG